MASTTAASMPEAARTREGTTRHVALDAVRGLALLLMLLDHGAFFAKVNVIAETYADGPVRTAAGPWFWIGLATNLAAPLFWCLAGTSVALMERRERSVGDTDRFLIVRAGVLLALDLFVVPWLWNPRVWPSIATEFDLLGSLAFAMLLLVFVRRLPARVLGAGSMALMAAYTVVIRLVPQQTLSQLPFWPKMLLTYDAVVPPNIVFPLLGWFPLVTLGLGLGRALTAAPERSARLWLRASLACAALFVVARVTHLDSDAPWRWGDGLHAFLLLRKGPPAIDFFAFNLSLGFAALSLCFARPGWLQRAPLRWLVAYGKVPLFLFVAHLVAAYWSARIFLRVLPHADGWRYLLSVTLAAIVLLPAAHAYRRAKDARRGSPLRYF